MNKISEIANMSGILEDMPNILSMALGAGETTLVDITKAYTAFANGGKKINPIFLFLCRHIWTPAIIRGRYDIAPILELCPAPIPTSM